MENPDRKRGHWCFLCGVKRDARRLRHWCCGYLSQVPTVSHGSRQRPNSIWAACIFNVTSSSNSPRRNGRNSEWRSKSFPIREKGGSMRRGRRNSSSCPRTEENNSVHPTVHCSKLVLNGFRATQWFGGVSDLCGMCADYLSKKELLERASIVLTHGWNDLRMSNHSNNFNIQSRAYTELAHIHR